MDAHAALTTTPQTADQIAAAIGWAEPTENFYLILEYLSSNGRVSMARATDPGETTFTSV